MDLNKEENSDNEAEQLDMIVEDGSDADSSDESNGDDNSEMDIDENEEEKPEVTITVPENSKVKYEATYSAFIEWQKLKKFKTFSEKVMLVYFVELSKIRKSTTLTNVYSMLKCTIASYHKVDIGEYKRLLQFLKSKEVEYEKKCSKEFTAAEITEFLNDACDEEFLVEKVVLIIGVCGGTRRGELCNLMIENVMDTGSKLIVTIQHDIKKIPIRRFSIEDDFYKLVKRYIDLRPTNPHSLNKKENKRFFLNYQKGKCTRQSIGINKIGISAKKIAQFLKIPDANEYTGHCYRRTTHQLLNNVGVDMTSLSRYGEWKSCHVTLDDMNKIFNWITKSIKLKLIPIPPKPVKKSKPKPVEIADNQPADQQITETKLSTDKSKTDKPEIVQSIEASTSKSTQTSPKVIQKVKVKRISYHTYKYSVVEIDKRRLEIVAQGWTPLEGTETVTCLGGFNDYQSAADWAEILDKRKTLDRRNWEFLQKTLENAAVETVEVEDIKEELEVKEEIIEF